MPNSQIFIGSSTESRDDGKKIAQHLSEAGFHVMRWWDSIPVGEFTLPRLIEISKQVDGALFLFNSDDDVWYRGQPVKKARDNVMLEFGLFSSQLGLRRCIIVRGEKVSLPSDVDGLTYQKQAEITSTAEQVVDHFKKIFAVTVPEPVDEFFIIADPTIIRFQVQDSSLRPWRIRDLYFGIEGAKAWLGLVREPSYAPREQEKNLQRAMVDAVSNINVQSIVSLGPGDAEKDKAIASRIQIKNDNAQYIPVDICEHLLQYGISELSNIMDVPVGILGDFEERMNFIHRQINAHAKRPILFLLNGNTLGNLEDEDQFSMNIFKMMAPGDYLLVDVSVASEAWKMEDDRRGMHKTYGKMYKRFFSQGIARRTGESLDKVFSEFDKRIIFQSGYSSVGDTRTIEIVDSVTEKTVYIIRRYKWGTFCEWVKTFHFKVISETAIMSEIGNLGDGIILVQK